MASKTRTPIVGGQWIVTVQLEVGAPDISDKDADKETHSKIKPHVPGTKIGEPIELRYVDSYLAKCPENVGTLIGRRIEELALSLKPAANKARKKK